MSQQNQPPSFADEVRGSQAKPIDKTLSRLSEDLYGRGSGVDGFKLLSAEQLLSKGIDPASLENKDSGFLAGIYANEQSHYVVVYAGTNEGKDWISNFRQGLGLEDAQYNQAIALAREAKVAFGDQVVITGHSLGGGLAGAASITTGIPAVTFNAAGVHDKTLERLGIDAEAAKQEVAENGQIRRYAVKNEILTDVQEHNILLKWALPDAVGSKIELPDPEPQSLLQKLIPGSGIAHGIEMHKIHSVIEAQEQAMPSAESPAPSQASGARDIRGSELADPMHPQHGMFQQALEGLRGLPSGAIEFGSEEAYRNAAAHAVVDASGQGMRGIDHVVAGRDGAGFFAVEGGLNDPGHRRIFVDQERMQSAPDMNALVSAPAEMAQPQEHRRTVLG